MQPEAGSAAARTALFFALAVFTAWYVTAVIGAWRRKRAEAGAAAVTPTAAGLGTGFVTNFFDTLGIGSFAPTTAILRALRLLPDEHIPGTLNVGHCLPVILQSYIFTAIVPVEMRTLIPMIAAAVAGAWLGAGVVSGLPRRQIRLGMGLCLVAAASFMTATQLQLLPEGGTALGLGGIRLSIAIAGNFLLGALMTLGIGLYAPCMVLISLLGMNVIAAYPIMMGSCAFLQPVSSARFTRTGAFSFRVAIGLTLGGIPAVLVAAPLVESMSLYVLRWVVVVVVLSTAVSLLLAARRELAVERAG
ncbi:MAG TPA: sulfite exporter TauE/SafE family protein [Gemmatimonadaceae bacterium]|jgi:uncharacterized membrane protein YfcA